jgi:glycosyltransferase involved in cell wall biosynthesis
MAGGFRWVELDISRKSTFFLTELFTLAALIRIYWREKPLAVHHFTVKCVLYGTIAARLNGVQAIVNSITGLGHLFIDRNFRTRLLKRFVQVAYRWILRSKRCFVIFQNPDDYQLFLSARMVVSSRAGIIRGSGVDTERFKPNHSIPENAAEPMILFASRLTREKGISELLEGFSQLQKRGSKAHLILAGSSDPGNPSSMSAADFSEWTQNDHIRFVGHVDDVESLIADSAVVVLPSYREGTPRILLEAAAMAKPIVATDVPGCREVVEDRKNGLLVPVKNASAIADALEILLNDRGLREKMGKAGRQKMLSEFDTRAVIASTLKIYNQTMGK